MLRKLVAHALMTVSAGHVQAAGGAELKTLFETDPPLGWAQCGPGRFTLANGLLRKNQLP